MYEFILKLFLIYLGVMVPVRRTGCCSFFKEKRSFVVLGMLCESSSTFMEIKCLDFIAAWGGQSIFYLNPWEESHMGSQRVK